jgi:very-short-patch-repair endonuclease
MPDATHARDVTDVLTPAQVLVRVPGCVLSHEVAAEAWELDLHGGSGLRHLMVPRNSSHIVVPGWDVVRRDLRDDEFTVLPNGLRVTVVPLAVADLAGSGSRTTAVVAGDSALRRKLVTAAVLADVLTARRGAAPSRRREVAALLDPQSGSVLETLLRLLFHEAGLAAPRTQHQVTDGLDLTARVDFAWPAQRLIVEADGFAFHADRDAYRSDRRRMNELERLGWRVLRFTWEDVVGRPEHVTGLVRSLLQPAAA